MTPYRAFLDANILFSAAYSPKSKMRQLWDLQNVELCSSGYAIEEADLNLTEKAQKAPLQNLIYGINVYPSVTLPDIPPRETHNLPPKDQPILWAAIDVEATHLLTGDRRHFGHLFGKTISGVAIMCATEFLQLCRERDATAAKVERTSSPRSPESRG